MRTDRIAGWGMNCLRLLTTWEAIEHAGPGEYDDAYLDYYAEVARRAAARGLWVFVDPHQDVWSRWTGGDGAPFWCFELAGLVPERFVEAARGGPRHPGLARELPAGARGDDVDPVLRRRHVLAPS